MTISELKPYQDKTVTIHMSDGETANVRILFVDAEYEDIIVDILDTNRPQQYRSPINTAAYVIPAQDIATVIEPSDSKITEHPGTSSSPMEELGFSTKIIS